MKCKLIEIDYSIKREIDIVTYSMENGKQFKLYWTKRRKPFCQLSGKFVNESVFKPGFYEDMDLQDQEGRNFLVECSPKQIDEFDHANVHVHFGERACK